MNVSASALTDLRVRTDADDGLLLRTIVNSTSATEASFALGLLREKTPERVLVDALNLRSTLQDIPESPFAMSVEFATLQKISGLVRRGQSWVMCLGAGRNACEIELLGQGNLCYDMVVRAGRRSSFLKPGPVKNDFVRPAALDLIMAKTDLLGEILTLLRDMGVVQNPRFYLSVEDWQMEHAAESFSGGISDLF